MERNSFEVASGPEQACIQIEQMLHISSNLTVVFEIC